VTDPGDDEQPHDGLVADLGEPIPTPASHASHSARNLVEWVGIVVGALLVAVVVKTFLIQAFFIPSLSMYSTLDRGDRVLVNKVSYRLHDIHRGDVVVFKRPPGVPDTGIKDLIKRVVGLPGDTVEGHDGGVYINGKRLEESYLDEGTVTSDFPPEKIPEGDIFVMGDNRGNSEDSRVFGPIKDDLVVGRAFVRVWPLQDFDLL
jgi:signal peptidase I